jgi:hypothetical protein
VSTSGHEPWWSSIVCMRVIIIHHQERCCQNDIILSELFSMRPVIDACQSFPPWCWAQRIYYQQLRFYFSLPPFPNPCSGTIPSWPCAELRFASAIGSQVWGYASYPMIWKIIIVESWLLLTVCLTVDCWLLCWPLLVASYWQLV